MRLIPILVSALLLLAACGTRGPLSLPPTSGLADHSSNTAGAGR